MALLVTGAFYYDAPDWDVGVSVIMATLAYFAAPWSAHVIVQRRWKLLPAALAASWLTVDGSYSLYWHLRNPTALAAMRDANFLPSLMLYALCGVVWYYRGSLAQLCKEISRGP